MNKILFITAFLPHDAAAAEKNTKAMLNDLGNNFLVDLIYFKYKDQKSYIPANPNVKVLRSYRNSLIIKVLNVLLTPYIYPLFSVRYNIFKMKKINRFIECNNYKAVVFDHSQMFLYAKFMRNKNIPKLMLSHDVILQRVSRTSSKMIISFCKFSEKYSLSASNSHLFALCSKDCDLLEKYYDKKVNLCQLYIDSRILKSYPTKISDEYIFMGKWSRKDNLDSVLWFFKEVAPHIDKPTTILIIGKDFPFDKINNNNSLVDLKILGFIDNPYPRIANCKALLSPLFTGAGIKVKVLEALACGTPVIGTDIAFEGISDQYKELMIKTNSAKEFLNVMNNLNIPLKQRLKIKDLFLKRAHDETIPVYLIKNMSL